MRSCVFEFSVSIDPLRQSDNTLPRVTMGFESAVGSVSRLPTGPSDANSAFLRLGLPSFSSKDLFLGIGGRLFFRSIYTSRFCPF